MISPFRLLRHVGRVPELFVGARQTPAIRSLVQHYLEIGKPAYPLQLPLRTGGTLTLSDPSEVKVFWNIFLHGAYSIPPDCKTILDCGANAGIFCVWALKQCPDARIVALEPFPRTFAELDVNIRQNHLEKLVQCIQVGLAAAAGDRAMSTLGDSPCRRLILDDTKPVNDTISVRCIALADCLQYFREGRVDLLKMDIEGSEWEVLLSTEASVLRSIRYIQIEYHEVPARLNHTPNKLFTHLMKAGHTLTFRSEDAYHTA